jgi:hypothetical protein
MLTAARMAESMVKIYLFCQQRDITNNFFPSSRVAEDGSIHIICF